MIYYVKFKSKQYKLSSIIVFLSRYVAHMYIEYYIEGNFVPLASL